MFTLIAKRLLYWFTCDRLDLSEVTRPMDFPTPKNAKIKFKLKCLKNYTLRFLQLWWLFPLTILCHFLQESMFRTICFLHSESYNVLTYIHVYANVQNILSMLLECKKKNRRESKAGKTWNEMLTDIWIWINVSCTEYKVGSDTHFIAAILREIEGEDANINRYILCYITVTLHCCKRQQDI